LIEDRGPDRILLGQEQLEIVFEALAEVSQRTRDIFVLYRLENMKQRDIAALYGVSVSAIEKHVVKALAHLTERFER
jgi:RNA polymerase sigma-70 factor (ECF subfamily)